MSTTQELKLIVVVLVFGIVLLVLSGIINMLQNRTLTAGENGPVVNRQMFLAANRLKAVIRAPIGEELSSRGLPVLFASAYGLRAGLLLGLVLNVVFAAIHVCDDFNRVRPDWWRHVYLAFLVGLGLLAIALVTGNVYPAMVAHAAVNLWQGRKMITGKGIPVDVTWEGKKSVQMITGWRLIPLRGTR